jgi:ribulose-5-phosphate 4-epimerase/fuculose-1-phosphate aldolase
MNDLFLLAQGVCKYVVGAEGNISKKIENGFIVKASGTQLSTLNEEDIIECTNKGEQLNQFNKRPSIETSFHSWLLNFENNNFIAHTHPVNTLKILCTPLLEEFANTRLFPDQVVYNGHKSCVVPYATPGEDLLKVLQIHVLEYIKTEQLFPKLILLQNHGIICCGASYKECIFATEICEKSAEIFISSKLLGNVNTLPEAEINKLLTDKGEIYRQKLL